MVDSANPVEMRVTRQLALAVIGDGGGIGSDIDPELAERC
jgi:hypothetical protein